MVLRGPEQPAVGGGAAEVGPGQQGPRYALALGAIACLAAVVIGARKRSAGSTGVAAARQQTSGAREAR
jgi:hypothetical protein